MAHFPQPGRTRSPRVRVPYPESINFNLGATQATAKLRKLSMTGGLAEFETPVGEVSLAEVVLNTASGPVTALVEFLQAAKEPSRSRPFRFIALDDHDYERLNSTLLAMRRQGLEE
ncbi:MAG TPA: hypothetical protein VHA33_20760 [Candidatus Angelobacter sp.]|jgi:hypothetical protein|nr:hypothetical protein [Candidatus Angelobacter sp.]